MPALHGILRAFSAPASISRALVQRSRRPVVPKADSGARGLPLSGSRTGELQGGDTDKSPEEILKQALQNAQSAAIAAETSLGALHELESAKREPFFHKHMRLIVMTLIFAKSVWKIVFTLVVLVGVQRAPLPLKAGLSAVSAALLALNGAQKGSLSESGALAAFTVGTLSLFASTRASWSLIGFYLSSSSLTSFASAAKSSIGDEYGTAPKRSWVQVFSNAFVPTAIAVALGALAGWQEAPLGAAVGSLSGPASAGLWGAMLGYYACCCGDTWASEVGVLSNAQPRLITSLRPVRAGTNGAVTPLGLGMSVLGGAFMGGIFAIASVLAPGANVQTAISQAIPILLLGLSSGLVGSVIDSVLGATLQFSGYDIRRRKVTGEPGEHVAPIAGVPLLSNNAVNLISATVTAVLCGAASVRVFA